MNISHNFISQIVKISDDTWNNSKTKAENNNLTLIKYWIL